MLNSLAAGVSVRGLGNLSLNQVITIRILVLRNPKKENQLFYIIRRNARLKQSPFFAIERPVSLDKLEPRTWFALGCQLVDHKKQRFIEYHRLMKHSVTTKRLRSKSQYLLRAFTTLHSQMCWEFVTST